MTVIDRDLHYALEYNPQDDVSEATIFNVMALFEGEHDGPSYRWIVTLIDGRYAFLIGGCCYTGWDCQSGLSSYVGDNPYAVLEHETNEEVKAMLAEQLHAETRAMTWRETKDAELGTIPYIDIKKKD